MKNKYLILLISLACLLSLVGCGSNPQVATPEVNRDVIYQVSTYGALSNGIFGAEINFAFLKKQGDFGLGTLEGLDGEMVALDGGFYQVKSDGTVHPIEDEARSPFAMITFFDNDLEETPSDSFTYSRLTSHLDNLLLSRNIFYAIRVDGDFEFVKARSVPKQEKPYPTLEAALLTQTVFELHNVSGTLVGFWSPSYTGQIVTAGYHFHFITSDRKAGGHVLDCQLRKGVIRIDQTTVLDLELPRLDDFYRANLEP